MYTKNDFKGTAFRKMTPPFFSADLPKTLLFHSKYACHKPEWAAISEKLARNTPFKRN